MSLESTTVRVSYSGDDSTTDFTFGYKFLDEDDLVVLLVNTTTGEETLQTKTTHYTVTGAGDDDGGTVTFLTAPTSSQKVVIYRDPAVTQTWDPEVTGPVPPDTIETELDRRTMVEQRLKYLIERSVRLPEGHTASFDTKLPTTFNAGDVLAINDDRDGLTTKTSQDIASDIEGLPSGGDEGAVLAKASSSDGDAEWVQYAYSGFSARFNAAFESTDLNDTLTKILNITYTAPQISLSATGASTIREKGDAVTSTTLTAAITKRSDPIKEVRFYDQTGSSLLDTQTSGGAIPDGGNSTYSWTGSFDDNQTFRVEVDDDGSTGGPTTVSATVSFTFVYPYYVGAGSSSLAAADVANLTKRVITESTNRTETITAGAGEVFYFAYPASYGTLSSILDVNGFETLPDWTLRVENITGLDSNAVSYNIYEFENPVTAGDYEYRFIQ